MSGIVYKQSYKGRDSPGTAGLNVRHLNYIATRPGAVYNKGCGFCLWGQLPGDGAIRIQTDLEYAKSIVRQASENHTLYRAILSVGKEDAENYGLYDRGKWEQLVGDHIHTIAKAMDIKPEDMCWAASFHYAKGHPHVHLMYWDNSSNPRPEFIQKERFTAKTEFIRAEISRDIYREKILTMQQDQRSQAKAIRTAVQAICREANPEKALNLPRIYLSSTFPAVAARFERLLQELPPKGSLRYAYLPPFYKTLVDDLIDHVFKTPELAKELQRYEEYSRQISKLYSNSEEGTEKALAAAREKLRKELGNEVMDAVRSVLSELEEDHPEDLPETRAFVQRIVSEVVPSLDSFHDLRKMLPGDGRALPDYYEGVNEVIKDIMADARVRLRLEAYALDAAGIDLSSKSDAPRKGKNAQLKNAKYFRGKILSEKEWTAYRAALRDTKRILRDAVNREVMGDLRTLPPGSPGAWGKLRLLARNIAAQVAPGLGSYGELKKLLPAERIPRSRMEYQIPGYHNTLNRVMGDVLYDARVRMRVQSCALEIAGIDLDACEYAPTQSEAATTTEFASKPHVLYGKLLTDDQWQSYQHAYREAKREIRRELTDAVRQAVGWTDEAMRTGTATLLCRLMCIVSQAAHQRQACIMQARGARRYRSRDMSREAKKDNQATQQSGNGWESEFE